MDCNLVVSDCIKHMETLQDASVDAVFTSPDYNLGIAYEGNFHVRKTTDYLAWTTEWCRQIKRLLKPEGSFFLNIAGAPSRPLLPFHVALEVSKLFVLQNTFHWVKSITVEMPEGPVSRGHFKPLTSKRFVNDLHEYIFHFSHTGNARLDRKAIGVPYADKTNAKRWKNAGGSDLRCRGNTWFITYETIQSRNKHRPHPATFPSELPELAFKLIGIGPESSVLDPFVGIGNSGIAAKRVGAGKFTGTDIEPFYVQEAEARISAA